MINWSRFNFIRQQIVKYAILFDHPLKLKLDKPKMSLGKIFIYWPQFSKTVAIIMCIHNCNDTNFLKDPILIHENVTQLTT